MTHDEWIDSMTLPRMLLLIAERLAYVAVLYLFCYDVQLGMMTVIGNWWPLPWGT